VNQRRDLLLEELGLAPVWRLRNQPASNPEAVAVPAPVPAADLSATVPAKRDGIEVVPATGRAELILRMDWPALKQAVATCTACELHKERNNTVFGIGDEQADWLLVGEAPGAEEDARGEPFVGQAGHLLDNMLAAIGLARGQNVYISNVLKCRPPGNRNPDPVEVARCSPHLTRQISLVRPKLILAMGRFAVQTLLGTDATITSLRGRLHQYQGVPLVVTYHPAYLLRSLADKAKAWEDLCLARQTMQDLLFASSPRH
jgi:DNA polymerase